MKTDTTSATAARARLLDAIYSAAAEPDAWKDFLIDLVGATDSRSARLLVMNADATRVTSSLKLNIDDGHHRQYVEHYVNTCPWRPELRSMRPGRLYSTYLHFSCRQPDFYRTEFFNDWARPQDIHHGVCGTVYRDREQTVQLLVQRTRGQGHFSEAETAFFNDLVPHIRRSWLITRQITAARARSEAIAVAAAREPLPFLLLDASGQVTYCSPGAEALIAGETMLTLRGARLQVASEPLRGRLQKLLKDCLAGAAARSFETAGDTLTVPRPNGASLQLLVTPVHPDIPGLLADAMGFAAIYLHDPQAHVEVDGERLRQLYGLSDAEARVAAAIAVHPHLPDVARRCTVSLHTVRSHLKAIFRKTATNCQADLVRLLLTGPACRRHAMAPVDPVLATGS